MRTYEQLLLLFTEKKAAGEEITTSELEEIAFSSIPELCEYVSFAQDYFIVKLKESCAALEKTGYKFSNERNAFVIE